MPFRLSALKRFARDGNPTTFLTLTINPGIGESVEQRAQQLSDAMKLLVKRMRRKFVKEPIEYFAVFEETKKGEPHLHMLLRAPFVPQRWISDVMNELIASPIVDIRKVGSKHGVAKYVAKYVAKGPRGFGKLKRYWCSKGYAQGDAAQPKNKSPQAGLWSVWKEPLCVIADLLRGHWQSVEWVGDHEFYSVGRWRPPKYEEDLHHV